MALLSALTERTSPVGTDWLYLTDGTTDYKVKLSSLLTSQTLLNCTLTNPTMTTPTLGVATVTSINKVAITAPASAATLTIPNGVTLTGPASSGTCATLAGSETLTNKVLTSPTLTTPAIGAATGTSLAAAGAVASSSSSAGLGYASGAGGAVTQLTSITTGVTLNAVCGTITTVSMTLAAGVDASFTLTNSAISANDVVVVSVKSYGGTADGIPIAAVQSTAAGSCVINIRNTGATTLDALAVLNFAVIKAVAA